MGNNQSTSEEEQKKLQEYVNRQQPQVNQYYSQNQQLTIQTNIQDDPQYHNQNTVQQNRTIPLFQVTKTLAVKSEIFLLKNSLKAVKINQDTYGVTFKYTSEFPAVISIYLCAQEEVNQNEVTQSITSIREVYKRFELPAAKEVEFPHDYFVVQLSKFDKQELSTPKPRFQYYPLIIQMERQYSNQEQKKSIYYCQFQTQSQKVEIHCFKSKLEQAGQGYVLNEVYGIHESSLSGKSEKECVVCMSEKINTMILPCKHMCLCNPCCDDMRKRAQKCPMCRGEIQSFMQLESIPQPQQQDAQFDQQSDPNKNPYSKIISTDPNAPQHQETQKINNNQQNNFKGKGQYIG